MCLLLGFPSPDHLRESLTIRQERQWYEYLSQEPCGQDRDDWLHALLVANIRAAHGAKGVQASDFLPEFVSPETTPEKLSAKLDRFFTRMVVAFDNAPEQPAN